MNTRTPLLALQLAAGTSLLGFLATNSTAGDFVWDNAGTNITTAVTTTVNYTATNSWNPDGSNPSGLFDNLIFAATGFAGANDPNTALNLDLQTSAYSLNGLYQTANAATNPNNVTINLVGGAGAGLTLNQILKSGGGTLQIGPSVPVNAVVNPTNNPLGNLYVTNTDDSAIQLQSVTTVAGDLIRNGTGGGILRLGTSGATFNNAISGNIVMNAGSLELAANNAGNVAGGSGRAIIMNSPNGTINFRPQTSMDFAREIDLNAFRTTISADRSAGTLTGQVVSTGTINVNRNDAYLIVGSGNSFGYAFDGINLGNKTLNIRNGLNGSAKAGIGVLTGSGTIFSSGNGDNNTSGLDFNTASPGFSGTVRFFEGAGHQITATGSLGSGRIILGTDQTFAPVTYPNADIGVYSPTVRNQPWSALLNYNANNPTTAPVAVEAYAGSQVNMGVVPGAGDVIRLREYGIVQGNSAELGGFTVGSNLLLPASNAIISHEAPGSADPSGIGAAANHFYGLSADHGAGTSLTIGAGTPWKGLSNDRFGRTFGGAGTTLTVAGGDNNSSTVEATLLAVNGKGLNLFTGGGTWASSSGNPVTVEIAGATNPFGNLTGTGGLGGTVLFQSDAATSGLSPAVVDKFNVTGTLQAQGASMFGGVPVEVMAGGGIDPGNANTFDTNVTFQSGATLLHNDNMLFTGTGTLTFNGGSQIYIAGAAPANTLVASTQPIVINGTGHLVRIGVDNVTGLDAAVPDAGARWEIAANGANISTAPLGTTLTAVQTITQTAGISTDGGFVTNDSGGNRAFVGPINVGNSGATFAATTGQQLVLMNAVSAGGSGTAPIQVGSATPLNNVGKQNQQAAVSNNSATLNPASATTAVIFENGLKSGTVNVVQHDFYLDGPDTNTKITGDINLGEGSRLYLGGGGSINTGNAFGGAAPRRGDLTPLLVAGTVTTGTINIGNYGRIEMGVDYTDPAFTATAVNGRGQLNQSFTVADNANLNPQDRRNLWVDRGAATTATPGIDLNSVTLGNNSHLAIQESGTDVRATLRLTGANATVSPGNGSSWDLKNVVNVGGGAKSLTLGRTDQPFTEYGVFGNVDSGITLNSTYARLAIRPGSTTPSDLVFNDNANARRVFNNFGTTPAGTNNGTDHTLSIVRGSDGVAANYLATGTLNSNSGNAWGFYVQDHAAVQNRNEIGAAININAAGGTLFSDRDGADAAFNGVAKLNTVNVNAANVTLATRNLVDLEVGNLNVTQNTIVKVDGARTDTAGNSSGSVRIGNVAAAANSVQFQNGRTTITGNVTSGTLTAGGTSLEFKPGSGTSTVNASSVKVNSLLAAKSGTTNFGATVLEGTTSGTWVAGLREGRIAGTSIDIATANPASNAATANLNDANNLGIRLDPRVGQNNASSGGVGDSARGWGDNQTWVYSGQIYDADGIFTLAEQIDDSVQIVVDGTVRLFNRNTTSVIGGAGLQQQGPFESWRTVTNTSTKDGYSDGYKQSVDGNGDYGSGLGDLTVHNVNEAGGTTNFGMGPGGDGWHDVEIRVHNGGGGAASNASLGWGNYFGLGLNSDGTTSLIGTSYDKPVDNGSMNIFRTQAVAKGNVDIDGGATVAAGGVKTIRTLTYGRTGTGGAALNLSGGNASDTESIQVSGTGTAAVLNLAAATDTFVTGKLNTGAGNSFTKSGAGMLTVTGTADAGNTGDVVVTGGELRVDGLILGGVITSGGGILSGVGTVAGAVTMTGATVSPGDNNVGTLNVTGAMSLDSASLITLTINDEAPSQMDRINNTGIFSAGSASLNITFNDTTYTEGTTAGDLAAATRYTFITGPSDLTPFGNSTLMSAGDLAALGLPAGEREITAGGQRFWLESGNWALVPIAPVPEPGSAALAAAAAALALSRRRRTV